MRISDWIQTCALPMRRATGQPPGETVGRIGLSTLEQLGERQFIDKRLAVELPTAADELADLRPLGRCQHEALRHERCAIGAAAPTAYGNPKRSENAPLHIMASVAVLALGNELAPH